MEKFVFEGVEYNIISEKTGSTERGDYQMKKTDQTRERELFAWRPWCWKKVSMAEKNKDKRTSLF